MFCNSYLKSKVPAGSRKTLLPSVPVGRGKTGIQGIEVVGKKASFFEPLPKLKPDISKPRVVHQVKSCAVMKNASTLPFVYSSPGLSPRARRKAISLPLKNKLQHSSDTSLYPGKKKVMAGKKPGRTCLVCLVNKRCLSLPCGHQACKPCLKSHIKVELDYKQRPGCVSCKELIPWKIMKECVNEQPGLLERYTAYMESMQSSKDHKSSAGYVVSWEARLERAYLQHEDIEKISD